MPNFFLKISTFLMVVFANNPTFANYQLLISPSKEGLISGSTITSENFECGDSGAGVRDECSFKIPKGAKLEFKSNPKNGFELDGFKLIECEDSLDTASFAGNTISIEMLGDCLIQAEYKVKKKSMDVKAGEGQKATVDSTGFDDDPELDKLLVNLKKNARSADQAEFEAGIAKKAAGALD